MEKYKYILTFIGIDIPQEQYRGLSLAAAHLERDRLFARAHVLWVEASECATHPDNYLWASHRAALCQSRLKQMQKIEERLVSKAPHLMIDTK